MELVVTRRSGSKHTILYDDDDHELLSMSTTWNVVEQRHTFYARGRVGGVVVSMHRLLLPDAPEVDHVNHNGLDNRRCNLRAVTTAENRHNRRPNLRGGASRHKGVFLEHGRYWRARIHLAEGRVNLGNFATEREAARAYDRAARDAWGEYAYLNFPEEV